MSEELTVNPRSEISSLISEVTRAGKDPAYLSQLLAVRREWEADEARKTFNVAISEFQRRAPIVAKVDEAHEKYYARMDRIWRETRPLITELGLAVNWQICELRDGNLCHVEGTLRHRDGHGEKLVMDVPLPELIRGQNKAQQMGSASTYAKRYAFCSALGIVTGDDFQDDDGNKAGMEFLTPDQMDELLELIDACRGLADWKEQAFWQWAGASNVSEIQLNRFNDVRRMLQKKLKPDPK